MRGSLNNCLDSCGTRSTSYPTLPSRKSGGTGSPNCGSRMSERCRRRSPRKRANGSPRTRPSPSSIASRSSSQRRSSLLTPMGTRGADQDRSNDLKSWIAVSALRADGPPTAYPSATRSSKARARRPLLAWVRDNEILGRSPTSFRVASCSSTAFVASTLVSGLKTTVKFIRGSARRSPLARSAATSQLNSSPPPSNAVRSRRPQRRPTSTRTSRTTPHAWPPACDGGVGTAGCRCGTWRPGHGCSMSAVTTPTSWTSRSCVRLAHRHGQQ